MTFTIYRSGGMVLELGQRGRNPLDFSVWSTMEQTIYRRQATPPRSAEELRERIIASAREFTPDMLTRITENVIPRAQACLGADGGHFEQFL